MWFRTPLAFAIALSLVAPSLAFAKKKKDPSAGVLVRTADYFTMDVSVKIGKKTKHQTVACFNRKAGRVKTTKKGLTFVTLAQEAEKLRSKGAPAAKQTLLREVIKKSKKGCAEPDFLSLKRYTGKFGAAEARTIYEKFAFAGSPAEIEDAVSLGLTGLVAKLTTPVDDTYVNNYTRQLRCDGRYPGDPAVETCDVLNPNNFYGEGVRYALLYSFRYTNNPFFDRFFLFFHDERLSASPIALGDGGEAHAFPKHVDMLRRAAYSGDYHQYMLEWNEDLLGNLEYLDGARNHGINPNENYGREFLQLGMIGMTNLDGVPNYDEVDIAQVALAFSGQDIDCENRRDSHQDEFRYCFRSFAEDRHYPSVYPIGDPNPHPAPVIFHDTKYQAVVHSATDVLEATFRTPWVAEDLARDIWRTYINDVPTTAALRSLATIIRAKNYNLIDVMRVVMTSRAALSQKSRKSIAKSPLELMFGFLRASELPLPASSHNYSWLTQNFTKMGQLVMSPPSIFGYDENSLAGSQKVPAWRNAALDLIQQSRASLAEKGYSFPEKFLGGLPGYQDSFETIDRIAARFNITLTAQQRQRLADYMDYEYVRCESNCNGEEYVLERKEFDVHPDTDRDYQEEKLRGAIGILMMQPEYRLK